MLTRTCLSIAMLGCCMAPAFGQEYYAADRTASKNNNVTNVNFTRAQDNNSDSAEAETIALLKEQLKRMELRLQELENDVEKKVAKSSSSSKASVKASEDVDQRLKDLEKGFESQSKSIEKIDSTIPGLVHSGHKKPKMTLFGRIHLDYWTFPEDDEGIDILEGGSDPLDRVIFRRLRIGVKGDLNDNMFYKYEGEFAGGVASSYRDAFIGFKDLPVFNTVIAGNHKRPYGLDHLNSSRYNVFIERPFIVEAINEDSRRLGISSNGVSEDQAWNWRYGVYHQELTQNTSGFFADTYQAEVAGRLAHTAWYDESSGGRGYLHLAASGSWGQVDGGDPLNAARFRTRPEARTTNRFLDTGRIPSAESNARFGLETVFNVGAFQLTGEYLQGNVEREPTEAEDVQFGGGYLQIAYFLTGEHTPWDRKTGTIGRVKPFENFFSVRDGEGNRAFGLGAWQVAARYSYADLQDEDVIGGIGESFTLGVNWWWNPNARMQLNYLVGEIRREPLATGNYQILGLRCMVDF